MTDQTTMPRSIRIQPRTWAKLEQIAIDKGYRTRNAFIISTLEAIASTENKESK